MTMSSGIIEHAEKKKSHIPICHVYTVYPNAFIRTPHNLKLLIQLLIQQPIQHPSQHGIPPLFPHPPSPSPSPSPSPMQSLKQRPRVFNRRVQTTIRLRQVAHDGEEDGRCSFHGARDEERDDYADRVVGGDYEAKQGDEDIKHVGDLVFGLGRWCLGLVRWRRFGVLLMERFDRALWCVAAAGPTDASSVK